VELPQECQAAPHSRIDAAVVRAVDGDTIKVKTVTSIFNVRMLGIDTPETYYQGLSQGPWGKKAEANLRKLAPQGTKVELELDEQSCDRYGRVLAYVWHKKKAINLNLQQLKDAMAVTYCIWPNVTHCGEFMEANRVAYDDKQGIFSDPALELAYDWRRRVSGRPEDQFVGDQLTFKVYRPGNKDRVPVPNRIFFYDEKTIPRDYTLERNYSRMAKRRVR
jgi:micrococcal nuclease